jgi:MtfA peptidase
MRGGSIRHASMRNLTTLPSHYYYIALFVFVAGWWLVMRIRRGAGIWRLRYYALPRPWMLHLHSRVPYYRQVPVELRAPYQDRVLQFVDGKSFRYADPLKLVEEDARVTLAGTGCLLLLNNTGDASYPDLLAVQLWPQGTTMEEILATKRPVKSLPLIWNEATYEATDPRDAGNKALPVIAKSLGWDHLPGTLLLAPWARHRAPEFLARHAQSLAGIAGGEAEDVFAVATEMFYAAPDALQKRHPQLYAALRQFYCIDPSRWNTRR